MHRYERGKIYKIVDVGYTKCYIGSTCETLSKRLSRHRKQYKYYSQGKDSFVSAYGIFDEFGIENCKIELIENYPSNSIEELRKREGFYIETINCVNRRVAGQTTKDYQNKHRERILSQRRERYTNNKPMYAEKAHEYYLENAEKIKQSKAIKIICECGATIRKGDKPKHERTKRHLELLSNAN